VGGGGISITGPGRGKGNPLSLKASSIAHKRGARVAKGNHRRSSKKAKGMGGEKRTFVFVRMTISSVIGKRKDQGDGEKRGERRADTFSVKGKKGGEKKGKGLC